MSGGRTAGFTLLETIVVLAILGLALTVTAGFIARPGTAGLLNAASSRVADAMRLARVRAMSENRAVPFEVSPDGHGFRIGAGWMPLGPSITLTMPGSATIVFGADGGSSGGMLSVKAAGGERLVQVDWLTGRVSRDRVP
jgi:prepilin-type N-terminal cleavage/methylation domain-containing protein